MMLSPKFFGCADNKKKIKMAVRDIVFKGFEDMLGSIIDKT